MQSIKYGVAGVVIGYSFPYFYQNYFAKPVKGKEKEVLGEENNLFEENKSDSEEEN